MTPPPLEFIAKRLPAQHCEGCDMEASTGSTAVVAQGRVGRAGSHLSRAPALLYIDLWVTEQASFPLWTLGGARSLWVPFWPYSECKHY